MLFLDRHVLLGLDGLVEPFRPAAPFHDPPGELVDDLHLAVLDDVVDVALEERLRLERLMDVVHELDVVRGVEVLDLERPLDLLDPGLGRRDVLVLLVEEVVVLLRELGVLDLRALRLDSAQRAGDTGHVVEGLGCGGRLAGDDQRRPRLVDQDRVDLVDDRVSVPALDGALERDRHVVAQVVEAELGVRAVGDVGLVGEAVLLGIHHRLDVRDGHPEPLVDAAVPFGVAAREIVVDGDEVDALAEGATVAGLDRRQRVQVQREARDERLALTGLHLGDVALVEDDPAHHLDVEHPLVGLAEARLAHGCERLEEQVVELLPVLRAARGTRRSSRAAGRRRARGTAARAR